MAKSLIITEKPSVAQEFARILGVSGRNDGYIENDSYVITWCVGHLVEMVYPECYDEKYKKWKLEDLPFLPDIYKYDVIPKVKKQYDTVHRMLHRTDVDTVYWAGDAGKEGQTIEENIRRFGGVRTGMRELRVWIDSQTEEEILRGIREAKDMSEYDNLAKSGVMRTIEDYAMGINFSRVMSVKYGRMLNDAAGTKNYTAIAVGRVMTCVLGMVVIREREIRNFTETPFYRVAGNFRMAEKGSESTGHDGGGADSAGSDVFEAEWKAVDGSRYFQSPLLYRENGFKKRESAQGLIEELQGKPACAESIEKGTSRKKAPLLFNLAELQAECAKRFKISPDETLTVAQDLYEKKMTTYPRTDARVLSTAVAKEIAKNIGRLKSYEPVALFVAQIMSKGSYKNIAKTQYTDDSKITDHYAIIPTGQTAEITRLNSLQRSVYDLIVRRFLSIFYPPAEYQTIKLVVKIEKEKLYASAKALKSMGYLEVAGIPRTRAKNGEAAEDDEPENTGLFAVAGRLKKGDALCSEGFFVKEGKTSPPKRYTSGSMVLAMENAGQLIEEEELREQIKGSGIGTSATRAEIIKKLIRIGYLNLNKKTQVLTPERFGEMIFEVVSMTVPALLNPKMTASWEKGLDGITHGTVVMEDYRGKLEDFIRRETEAMIAQDIKAEIAARIRPFIGQNGVVSKGGAGREARRMMLGLPCPVCGGDIVTTPFGYGCGNYKKDGSGCRFTIGKVAEKELTPANVKELLTDGRTGTIRGFHSKTGKKFDARVALNRDEDGKVTGLKFDFEDIEPKKLKGVKCPRCGGDITKAPFGYGCANYSRDNPESCRFFVGKIASVKLKEAQVKALLTKGKTEVIEGFVAKTGMKFDAPLKLTAEGEIIFDFPEKSEPVETSVKCPECGGLLKKSRWRYECVCGFRVSHTVAKVTLTEEAITELFESGRTKEKINGFVSRTGNVFDAYLKFEEKQIKFDFPARENNNK